MWSSCSNFFLFLFALMFALACFLPAFMGADCSASAASEEPKVDNASRAGPATDAEAVERESEAIRLDGLSVKEMQELRNKAEKHAFQAEVNRMMKLIINSLYRNKEIFLRELISNASDALDKIRLLSLTDKSLLQATNEMSIKIKADKEAHTLTIIDTGIGMTKADLINNLGTIARSGTADFLSKLQDASSSQEMTDLIGQFGVGFYSSFLVADKVIVATKHNDDKQYIWESDADNFSIVEDPRGNSLKRGSAITLHLKEEAYDYLEEDTVKELIHKYSQFINFSIYLWSTKTVVEEEPVEEEEDTKKKTKDDEEEDAKVEDEEEESKEKETRKIEKTIWDWVIMNDSKPIWTRKQSDILDEEYSNFYKSITKDSNDPLTHTHFVAEGEVSFKSLLFVPKSQPSESFNQYGQKSDHIKLYVRRVFITDNFQDMMPSYLNFVRGVVDSDDLPLNVSRETLQQHKLLKVIKKKLVRKALEMLKKIPDDKFAAFWQEYSTNVKLGVIEDAANRTRLAKLLRFFSSHGGLTSLAQYVERMKEKQEQIFFMGGTSIDDVKSSPFVERLLKKGYEVLYLTEPVDEYAISALLEFEGKKFQNVAKEGVEIDSSRKLKEELESRFKPLTKWLKDHALKEHILKAEISDRLDTSPCALITSRFGWTANMQRIVASQTHTKSEDVQRDQYLNQKKALEINPRHPLIKELLRRVQDNPKDAVAKDMALMMFNTATLRSGYMLRDTVAFATHIEALMRQTLGIDVDEKVEEEEETLEEEKGEEGDKKKEEEEEEEEKEDKKDEL